MGSGAVIIFDIDSNKYQKELVDKLKLKEYHDTWYDNKKKYPLPNNSLWNPNKTLDEAQSDLLSLELEIKGGKGDFKISKYVILQPNPWKAKVGDSVK